MLQAHQLAKLGKYYFLPGQQSLVKQRNLNYSLSQPLRVYAVSLIPALTRITGVLAIYLTGSLAMNNTDGHDDIDLMVITQKNRLWTTRFLLTLYTTILGLRRQPHSHNIMGKLCLNLYLTPNAFALPSSRRSLYTAYELTQAVPLYDPYHTQSTLLLENSWLKEYLPNFSLPPAPAATFPTPKPSLLEKIAYFLQYRYMRPKITREYITKDAAYFHPHDPSRRIKL
jgi:D-beta-D-heptose 7-phosphate kinase/D-beta-D-heptose 1-phosphate adenosyltransferase